MDCPVYAVAAEQGVLGGIDDGIGSEGRDIESIAASEFCVQKYEFRELWNHQSESMPFALGGKSGDQFSYSLIVFLYNFLKFGLSSN